MTDVPAVRQRQPYRAALCAAVALCGPLIVPTSAAAREEVAPGRAWVQVRYPASPQPEEDDDVIARGSALQSLKLASVAPNVDLVAQGQLTYVRDTKKLPYNNKAVAGVGLAVQALPAPFLTLHAGIRHDWEHRYVSGRDSAAFVGFAGWNLWKELGASPGAMPDLIVSSWGEARYPSAPDPEERHNAIVEGAAELARPILGSTAGAMLQLTTSIDFKADTKELDYNNQLSPALGMKFGLPVGEVARVELGTRYEVNYRFYSDRLHHGPAAWLGASARW